MTKTYCDCCGRELFKYGLMIVDHETNRPDDRARRYITLDGKTIVEVCGECFDKITKFITELKENNNGK